MLLSALRVLVSEHVVCGDMVKWKCLPCGIVNPSAIVLNTVANYQIINVEQRVVDGYLVEYVGCDGNARSLVFHNHPGAHVAAEEHGVGSQMLFADGQLHLVGKQWGRVAQVVDQVVDKMLPHPLFGSECNIAPPKNVENLHPLADARQFHVERRQVELHCLFVCHCSPGVDYMLSEY